MSNHDWLLVAPWWHWPSQGGHARTTRPALQKYDTSDPVSQLLADPQLRLKFLDQVDRVASFGARTSKFLPPAKTMTSRRKLYLTTHSRFYLVVCALHCDAPGLPRVDEADVCETGFVVRRRKAGVAAGQAKVAKARLQSVNAARRSLDSIDRQIAVLRTSPGSGVRLAALQVKRDAVASSLEAASAGLASWANTVGVERTLEGWVPRGVDAAGKVVRAPHPTAPGEPTRIDGRGQWEPVAEVPTDVEEATFPLYPLIAPDGQPMHDAAGSTIYFGMVPTGTSDVDDAGDARFDPDSTYEVRCFVRRHDPRCTPTTTGRDCHGDLVWSDPTEGYRLAGHFDLRGTANRPVTVQLPDLVAMQAEAGSTKGGVRMRAPAFSSLDADLNNSFPQICSFSIPLITFVALFVFRLFLPVVMIIFNLWFLLLLKFCIPPDITIDADIDAALAITPPQIEAGLSSELQATWDTGMEKAINDIAGIFKPASDAGMIKTPWESFKADPSPMADKARFARLLFRGEGIEAPVDDRVFEPRVERHQVVRV